MIIKKNYKLKLQYLPIKNKNREIKKINTRLINDFFDETLFIKSLGARTPYFINICDLSVKVKFIDEVGKDDYKLVLKYGTNDLNKKSLSAAPLFWDRGFKDTFYNKLTKMKIKVNKIIHVSIDISYEIPLDIK